MSDVLLGADLGTSGLKLVALDEEGTTVAEAERGYELGRPQPGWAETRRRAPGGRRSSEALAALAPALRGRRVRALGLSGQMHGAVLVDAARRRAAAGDAVARRAGSGRSSSGGARSMPPTAPRWPIRWCPG